MHVYGLGDEWALFLKRKSLTPACSLRRAKVGFGTDGGFLYVRLYGGDVVALFLEERKADTLLRYAEPEVVLRGR